MPETWNTGPDSSVAEAYKNTFTPWTAIRHWMDPQMMIGGSILNADDWSHLRGAFGITHCLSVESERDDEGKGVDNRLYLPTPDDGSIPIDVFSRAIEYAERVLGDSKNKLYVHCQMGGSRSPAVGYAILRGVRSKSPEEALAAIRRAMPDWGTGHPYHFAYMAAAEEVLKRWPK